MFGLTKLIQEQEKLIKEQREYYNKEYYRSQIKTECIDELVNLVAEISPYCLPSVSSYTTNKLQDIVDKYCGVNKHMLQ